MPICVSSPSMRPVLSAAALICLITLLDSSSRSAFAGPVHRIQTRSSRLCGQDLSDAISLICGGNYASPGKRSSGTLLERYRSKLRNQLDYNEISDWSPDKQRDEGPREEGDFAETKSTYSILKSLHAKRGDDNVLFDRHVRGIVEECCHKSCSVSQITQYCERK